MKLTATFLFIVLALTASAQNNNFLIYRGGRTGVYIQALVPNGKGGLESRYTPATDIALDSMKLSNDSVYWYHGTAREFAGVLIGGGSAIATVFGRTGAVDAQSSDYSSFYTVKTNNLSDLSNAATARTNIGLGSVENTTLSTWPGTSNVTTLGTIGTGVWGGTAIADNKIASALTGKTYNALTLTSQTTGFTVAGGTSSKTLTVAGDASVSGSNTGDQFTSTTAGAILGRYAGTTGAAQEITPSNQFSLNTSTGAFSINTLNQNTTGSAGSVTNALSIGAELISGGATSYNGGATKTLGIQSSSVTNTMLAGSIADNKISSSTNWNTAYSDRASWDGGSTGLTAATGRTSLGGTTVGQNLFTATNPSAITFPKALANNTVSFESAATHKQSIGVGTDILDSIFTYALNLYNGTGTGVRVLVPIDSTTGKVRLIDITTNGALTIDSTSEKITLGAIRYNAGTNVTLASQGNNTYNIDATLVDSFHYFYQIPTTSLGHFVIVGADTVSGVISRDLYFHHGDSLRRLAGVMVKAPTGGGGGGGGNYSIATNTITYSGGPLSPSGTDWCCAGSGGVASGKTSPAGSVALYLVTWQTGDDHNLIGFDPASDSYGSSFGSQTYFVFPDASNSDKLFYADPDFHDYGYSSTSLVNGDTYGLRRNADNTVDVIMVHSGTLSVVHTYATLGTPDVLSGTVYLHAYIGSTGTPIHQPQTNR